MKKIRTLLSRRVIFVCVFLLTPCSVMANNHGEIKDWQVMPQWMELSDKARKAYYKAGKSRGENTTRLGTAMRLAMFTAANAANPRYSQYLEIKSNTQADNIYAAGFAAAKVLAMGYGEMSAQEEIDKQLTMSSKGLDKATIKASESIGLAAAELAVNRAREKVVDNYPHYKPQTTAGVYITPHLPAFPPQFLDSKPWFLDSREAIRPEAPPALDSELWAKDFNEVKNYGRKKGSKRTDVMAEEATRWAGQDNEILIDQAVAKRNMDFLDIVRIYAMLSMSTDDSGLAVVEAKYHYNFWRPITAIRRAELDDNDATDIDAGWEPYGRTPNHPEYPCAHCQYGGGTAEILEGLVPRMDGEEFKIYDKDTPEDFILIEEYREFEKRMSDSRIYIGAHYRTSNDVGERMGREVAKMALETFAKPIK